MKNKNLSLLDVFSIAGILGYSFLLFFGMYFETDGNLSQSFLYSSVLLVILIFAVLKAKKHKKTYQEFRTNAIKELLFILIAILCLGFTFSSFNRFFYIQSNKSNIQNTLSSYIDNSKYRYVQYEFYCTSRVAKYKTYLLTTTGNSHLASALKNSLQPPGEYLSKKARDIAYLSQSEAFINFFSPVSIVDFNNEFNDFTSKNEFYFNKLANEMSPKDGDTYGNFLTQLNSNGKNNIFSGPFNINILGVFLWVLFTSFTLITWFFTPRHITIKNIIVALKTP
jgi:hypothetical protein